MTSQPETSIKRWRASRWARFESRFIPYVYVAPFFVLFAVFGLFTVVFTAWVSLHEWHIFGDREFAGLANYTRLMADDRFWKAVGNTFSILLLSTVPQIAMALVIAETLNDRRLRAAHFFRSAMLVPNITSVVAIAIVFESIFGRHFGILNSALTLMGLESIHWQASRLGSHFAISTMVNWQWTGYNSLIFLAGLLSIPRDLYEAAEVDGATRRQQFFRISVPLLRPAILFVTILSVIGGLQIFAQPLLFGADSSTTGGSNSEYLTILLYLYNHAFRRFNLGYASAIAWVLIILTAIAALLVLQVLRRFGASLDDPEDRQLKLPNAEPQIPGGG